MTYPEAIQFLYGLRLFGAKFGLENTLKLAALAGNPHERLRFIHVAGTNGKGSTCAMLESVYRAAGLRAGLFTSPHLVTFRERIQVGREMIPEADVVRLVEKFQKLMGEFPKEHHPTFFEVVTVMALQFFAEKKCELVIWETGLGGRLDATNIVTPLASVITNIALDHQQWLGDTPEKIAFEKAGIIKPGVPVTTATDEPGALAVIKKIAEERGAPLTVVGQASSLSPFIKTESSSVSRFELPNDSSSSSLQVIGRQFSLSQRERAGVRENCSTKNTGAVHREGESLKQESISGSQGNAVLVLPLLGEHQKRNAALALAAVEILQNQIPVTEAQIRQGLKDVQWPGRLQFIERDGKRFLLDGAHNVAGAKVLREAIEKNFRSEKRTLVLGILEDKDWRQICEALAPLAETILAVPVSSNRTADANALAEACRAANPAAKVLACASLEDALQKAPAKQLMVITGSLYLVGEALEWMGYFSSAKSERELNEWNGAKN